MAPGRIPGQRGKKDADYSAIGVVGRKTGVTVQHLGPRDEHGLEPLDDLFSSPQKGPTPARANGAHTGSESETMVLADGTDDDASSVIRSARKGMLLPPKSRSPIRTSLGQSPRRSMIGSSPLQNRTSTSARASLLAPPRRSLKSGRREEVVDFPEEARPKQDERIAHNARTTGSKAVVRARKQSYSLLDDDEEEPAHDAEDLDDEPAGNNNYEAPADESDPVIEEGVETEPGEPENAMNAMNEDVVDNYDDDEPIEELIEDSPISEVQPTKRGTKRKSPEAETGLSTAASSKQHQPARKRGRPPKSKETTPPEDEAEFETTTRLDEPEPQSMAPPKKKRGRGPGSRNPKARISSTKSRQADKENQEPVEEALEEDAEAGATKKARRKPKSRPMMHLQEASQEAAEEVMPVVLRSGRTTVKPLAYWRGEQIVYEPPKRIGKTLLPGGYGGIDPGRNDAEPKTKPTPRRRGRKRGTTAEPDDSADEHEDLWETEGDTPGVLTSAVYSWDPELQTSTEDAYEEVELALTATALERRLQWDKANTFKFGKTLTLPFFHSGVVDLPPGGEKRPKPSKKNHMIFWVFSGRVQVDISGNEFSIGRGGMWQVPRGNVYGLANPFEHNARIFFAQGSYMEQPEDEAALLAGANGLA